MIILAWMIILSEYPNDKRLFILFTSITASFANYNHVGLCTTRNEDKSVILTHITLVRTFYSKIRSQVNN